jgi:hypothetical protein
MKRWGSTIGVAVLLLLTAACGSGQKVGNEDLLNFQEQKNAQRLGEATPAPTPGASAGALTVGSQPTPPPRPKATPPKVQYFDVTLVANSPFYKPGNALTIRVGVTLRVTNVDKTPERSSGRSFTDQAGSFNSGILKPGQSWTHTFTQPAQYEVVDQGLTFATARLQVSP